MTETGRIIKIISDRYEVPTVNRERVLCVTMEELHKTYSPVVGDLVEFERLANQNGIQKILPRKDVLVRPFIANVGQAVIVMSYEDPDFSTTLISRLILSVYYAEIRPVLYITKLDLIVKSDAIYEEVQHYIDSGYEVYQSREDYAGGDLIQALKGNISMLTEQSGVGKSFPLNRIDPTFYLQTQEIDRTLGGGKHTTRRYELYGVVGGWVANTPGFPSLNFAAMSVTRLAECIPDFQSVQDACGLRGCIHVNKPGCTIRVAVEDGTIRREHYARYLEIVDMI